MSERSEWVGRVADHAAQTGQLLRREHGCSGLVIALHPAPPAKPTEMRVTAVFDDQTMVAARPWRKQ